MLDDNQEYILGKLKYGFENKKPPEFLTDEDIDMLNWSQENHGEISKEEWIEWSRKTHWALQVAFIHDTVRMQNKEKFEEWRAICSNIIRDVVNNKRNPIVIDNLVIHFMVNDLLHFTKKRTKEEKSWIKKFWRKIKM